MVTILDVAREAQVAPSTVSLVTNNNGYVSQATRRRVESTIKRLGYKARRPRARARKLNLAVIYTPSTPELAIGPIALSIIEGIHSGMERQQLRPSLIAAVMERQDSVFQQALEHHQFDGALVVGASQGGDFYARMLLDRQVPTVLVNRVLADHSSSSVTADFRQGGYLATAELASYGHRRIGFVALDHEHWPSAERYQGHLKALADFNLSLGDNLLVPMARVGEDCSNTIAEYCQQAIASGHTAFAVSYRRGQQVADYLAKMGLAVPQDVSLVGFDGPLKLESQGGCMLASIDYDKHYLGELALETLRELIANQDRIGHMIKSTHVTFIEGQSLAAPPQLAGKARTSGGNP